MDEKSKEATVGIVVSLVIGTLVAAAGSAGSVDVGGMPVFAVGAIIAFVVNWIAFVPAYRAGTEHYYDITGTATYLTVLVVALALSDGLDARAFIAAAMVAVWGLRLGTFLFRRVRKDGGDGRFDDIKTHGLRFFMTWTLQGLWVFLTMAAALAIITSETREPLGVVGFLGIAVWLGGFAIEAIADQQKRAHRAEVGGGKFITTGLWAWSRHPNYFGEITLWTGMAILSLPILSGTRWAMLISPVFVFLLITKVSGIPLLKQRGMEKWGDDPEYLAYLERTPLLVPRPPKA